MLNLGSIVQRDPEVMAAQGFTYYSVGRPASHPDGVPAAVLKNGKKA